ncbi:Aureobasidin resistance protein Aur1 [Dissophora ornata]|nr:Aureobasidin resistance protein Aur1 [Dissophora ornata]
MDKPVWLKLPIALIAVALLVPKQTRPFMMPFLAIAGWLILFYTCRFIPAEWRPHIYTSVLPALDNIIYGDNLSDLLASSTAPWKDLLAWLPYGIFHFVMPIVVAVLIALFAPPGTLPVFARTFGYMNVAGVMTQLLFPCAPPWYETRYGPLQPAAYSMPGDPGGLTRVDDILGTDMYRSTFTASPLVFGAFPSLHSGCAWQLAFFTVFVFGPRSIPFALIYVFWIWWAAMYLSHHYVVDLVGGSVYAIIAFWIGSSFLPSVLPHEDTRLSSLEKQSFFKDSEYALVGGGKDWDSADDDSDNEATEDSDDTVVVDISNEMETNLSSKSVLAKDRGTETAACSSSGRLASPTVNSSLPTALPTVLDTSSSSNIPIPAAAEGAAEDSGKRLSRSFQLSLLNSSSGPAPNSPSKSNFLEQEVIATSVTLSESIRESGVNQLLTGSGTPGLFVSTTIMVNTPGVNMGRRRKDD